RAAQDNTDQSTYHVRRLPQSFEMRRYCIAYRSRSIPFTIICTLAIPKPTEIAARSKPIQSSCLRWRNSDMLLPTQKRLVGVVSLAAVVGGPHSHPGGGQ